MKERKSRKNVVLAVAGVAAPAAIALWQFYVFVTFSASTGAIDLQGGRKHLWWAIAFAVIAFIAAFLVASFFMRYDRNEELHITSPPAPRTTSV